MIRTRPTVGIVGAGQLGQMLALAAYPLGVDVQFLDRTADSPGGRVGPILVGEFADRRVLRQLAARCDVLTFDWENVSVESLASLPRRTRIAPSLRALAMSQDRLAEKRLFERLGIPTTRYAAVANVQQLQRALRVIGLPGVLKTRRLGYDGKGQAVLRTMQDVERSGRDLLSSGAALIYEEWIDFDCEVSMLGVRGYDGDIATWPLNGNEHADGILRVTRAPFGPPQWARRAASHVRRVLEHFDYVGVLNIEFFVRAGRLIANETAPRVHNSGHWTIEGAVTSQFENHLRAILGWPLGSTAPRGHAGMLNLIGTLPAPRIVLSHPGVHLHDYQKVPRPARKLGHLTLLRESARQRDRALAALQRALGLDGSARTARDSARHSP